MQSLESAEDIRPAHWDADVFRTRCQVLAKNAMKGTGLSHDLFVEMFSGGVERLLDAMPDEWRARAQDIAREFDYATRAELEKMWDEQAAMGYCSHGLDPYYCPAGCGDLDQVDDGDDSTDYLFEAIDPFEQLLWQVEADLHELLDRFDREVEEALAPLKG